MIDRLLYRFFAWIDSWVEWVEKQFQKSKKKKKKKKINLMIGVVSYERH